MQGSIIMSERDLPAGYQRHPSTHTAHFFAEGSTESACKRERRTTGPMSEERTDFFVCSFCAKKASRLSFESAQRERSV